MKNSMQIYSYLDLRIVTNYLRISAKYEGTSIQITCMEKYPGRKSHENHLCDFDHKVMTFDYN